jgi:hypothetical protein
MLLHNASASLGAGEGLEQEHDGVPGLEEGYLVSRGEAREHRLRAGAG